MNHTIQDVETFRNKLKRDEYSDDQDYKLFISHFFNLNMNTNFSSIDNLKNIFDREKLCDAICTYGNITLLQYFSEQYSKHNTSTGNNSKWTLCSDALNSTLLSKNIDKINYCISQNAWIDWSLYIFLHNWSIHINPDLYIELNMKKQMDAIYNMCEIIRLFILHKDRFFITTIDSIPVYNQYYNDKYDETDRNPGENLISLKKLITSKDMVHSLSKLFTLSGESPYEYKKEQCKIWWYHFLLHDFPNLFWSREFNDEKPLQDLIKTLVEQVNNRRDLVFTILDNHTMLSGDVIKYVVCPYVF